MALGVDKLTYGAIPGSGMTHSMGSFPFQNPPQHTDQQEFLESIWAKLNAPENTVKMYGLLKAGMPAEAIARTLLFSAFSHGVITPTMAMLSLPVVLKQIVALGHFLGLKKMKIRNPNPNKTQYLAKIAQALDLDTEDDNSSTPNLPSPQSNNSQIFTGLGL